MTEEIKAKRDEMAELNLIKGGPEHTFLNCFQRGFDAAYKLMEVENAVIRAELIQHDMDNGSSWRDKYETCKSRIEKLEKSLREALKNIKEYDDGCLYCGVSLDKKYEGDDQAIETQWHIENCWYNRALAALKADEGEG